MFVTGALELERPFLGPLYKFIVLHPRDSMRRVPSFVSFILHFLADQVADTRHYNCAEILESSEEAPRVDAQASDVRTGIGGWFPRRGDGGNIEPKLSPWFSLEITHEEWPWVCAKSQKASLIISTLEALAVLVALKLRYGEEPRRSKERVRIAPALTDNRGNGAALNKLMTTKFPASALLMELACYMKKMSIRAVVEWAPREGNKEADRLANGDHRAFDPALRIPVSADPSSLSWVILPEALAGCSPHSRTVPESGDRQPQSERVQPGGLAPQSLWSSKTPQESLHIRAELPSNGYPQPSGSFHLSAYFKPLRHIWADWVRPLWTSGVPPPGTCPFQCLSLFLPLVRLYSFPFIRG